MDKARLSVVRYERSPDSLREAVEACEGLSTLRPGDKVIIKPNLVGWDEEYPVAPYGVYTTSRLVEDMVMLLRDAGATKIIIAEGSVRNSPKVSATRMIYGKFGYPYLAQKYGVQLVDLLDGPFTEVDFGEFRLLLSTLALEADFLINLPVLKTHNSTKLSLGFKNLKGCLHVKSRKFCHHTHTPLDLFCSHFVEAVKPKLTVLDGIYGLERGPFFLGTGYRLNAIVTSKDPLAVDMAGARILGFDPKEVPHIALYAQRHGRSSSLEDIPKHGTAISDLVHPLKWDFDWRHDNTGPRMWDKLGIAGISLPKYDQTLCTGCAALYNPLLMMLTSAHEGKPFDGIEVLTGKRMKPTKGFNTTILFGNCTIKANRKDGNINRVVFVRGCPPAMEEILGSLKKMGLKPDPESYTKFRKSLLQRYRDNPDFDPAHFYLPGSPLA